MGRLLVLLFFFLLCMLFHVNHCASNFSSFSPGLSPKTCPPDERLALLQFKHSISTGDVPDGACGDGASYRKTTDTWEEDADCCSWDGVSCGGLTGRVIGLDLSCSMLTGTIRSNSSLFQLSHLQSLNLAYNNFDKSPIPSEFGFLVKLTHLDLSWSNFSGEIPHEISYLSKLVSLDLAGNDLQVGNYAFQKLIHNLTELRVLDLSESNMSLVEPRSLLNISSTLRSLRLSYCFLNGEIPDDFSRFSLLDELDLSDNYDMTGNFPKFNQTTPLRSLVAGNSHLSGTLPDSIGSLKSLEQLDLSKCSLTGSIPASLANLEQLNFLDLGENQLVGQIPDVFGNFSKLRFLSLASSNFAGQKTLWDSIVNLKSLERLDLRNCSLTESIPTLVANLEQLEELDLGENQFVGQIPDLFGNLTKLIALSLASNNFVGPLPFSVFDLTQLKFIDLSDNQINGPFPNNVSGLAHLDHLYFSSNQLNGKLPSWLFTIPSLSFLDLSSNQFTGCFPIHPLQQPNSLERVDLSNNEIHGPIRNPIFELVNLGHLDLSFNNLIDVDIEWNMLQRTTNLFFLDLSHNTELSLRGIRNSSVSFALPKLNILYLSSCNITEFPDFLQTLENLGRLDLDNNKIHGMIPATGSEVWKNLGSLNLSHNSLTGLEQHPWNNIVVLDLSSNMIQGPLLVPPHGTNVFMISKNKLSGQISSSICTCSSLLVLDLSNNRLNGAIPRCLGNLGNLEILDLQNNNFHGSIPDTFVNDSNLWYVNLNGNQFQRQLPQSLVNCSSLKILDLGNNKINDNFPSWLGTLLQLKVLILRSNNFHGVISLLKKTGSIFEELQILDLSSNRFNGILPVTLLGNLKSMMNVERDHNSEPRYVGGRHYYTIGIVTVTMKGSEFSMPQILTIFRYIDFSNNRFEGEIPEVVCWFKSLIVLNFSHNNLAGHIPSSIGNFTELESLDLSSNKLVGRIPHQLEALTFLEVLNLSYNQLVGPIPDGRQLRTFSNDSYVGNLGLCGFPLSKKCYGEPPPQPTSATPHEGDNSTSWFDWKIVMMGYGSGVVIGLSMGYIVFTTGKPRWFVKMVEKKQDKIIRRINRRHRGGRKLGNPRSRQ